jgi:hypothetical protein
MVLRYRQPAPLLVAMATSMLVYTLLAAFVIKV